MKLISNRIRSTNPSSSVEKADPSSAEKQSEISDSAPPPVVTTLPAGSVGEGAAEELHRERGGRKSESDPAGGLGLGGAIARGGPLRQLNTLPPEEDNPSTADSSEPPPPPPIDSPVEVSESRSGSTPVTISEDRHQITWVMLRLLAANGKVKAADGSDLLVTFLGEEPPLGDVFQIEAISPDMEQRSMTVVVLANQQSIEVLGGQETIVVDSAPFQIERQPITTSQELAEAIFKFIEIELRPMGDLLVKSAREMFSSGDYSGEGE